MQKWEMKERGVEDNLRVDFIRENESIKRRNNKCYTSERYVYMCEF